MPSIQVRVFPSGVPDEEEVTTKAEQILLEYHSLNPNPHPLRGYQPGLVAVETFKLQNQDDRSLRRSRELFRILANYSDHLKRLLSRRSALALVVHFWDKINHDNTGAHRMWPYKSWVAVVQNFLYVDTVWEDLCKEVQSVQREALVHGWRSRDFDLYLVTEGVVRRHEQLYVQRYRLARTPDKPNLNHFPVDNVDWMAYEKVAGGLWSGVSSQYHLAQEQRTGPKDALALAKEAVRWYDDSDRPLMLDEYTHTWEGMGMVPKDPFDPNLTDCETGEEDSENQGDEEDQEAL